VWPVGVGVALGVVVELEPFGGGGGGSIATTMSTSSR
jgi:hypothetical protein